MTTEEFYNLIEQAEQGDTEAQFALGEYSLHLPINC